MPDNVLYYGDNLDILGRYIADESVDLIYLDPPFNSNATYNVLFAEKNGTESASQIKAFEDTWHWDAAAARAYDEVMQRGGKVADAMEAFSTLLGQNDMLAYLAMMAPRLVELRRVLKPTGSIYLHCDPTAGHYLKVLMDAVFGLDNFRNELSWRRSNPKSHIKTNFPNCRDVILRYSKTGATTFNMVYEEHDPEYVRKAYKYKDSKGQYRLLPLLNPNDDRPNLTYEFLGVTRVWRWTRERMEEAYREGVVVQLKPGAVPQYKKYLAESRGRTITDNWGDIEQAAGNEALGYPTQKPEALLERIISASSNEGDVVLDPFCGCGTAIVAAQKLKRRWVGIDITPLATNLIKYRLANTFDNVRYQVVGEPTTLQDAEKLAAENAFHFQYWALGLVGARPEEEKKGADRGIDGRRRFYDPNVKGNYARIVLSVKAGKTQARDVRDLRGVVERENAAIGVLITMREPTGPMRSEAASAGFYESPWGRHPRVQILAVADLLAGKTIDCPKTEGVDATFKRAPRHVPAERAQQTNFIDEQS